jgi:VanZ family protein
LKSSDLFFNENGKKYFKILFLFSYNLYWYLGRDFLKVYQLYFDMDKKLIYIPIKNENETESSNSSNFKIFNFWLTFVLGILVIFLVIYIARYLKKYPRKKRANELEDDFEYTIQENLNNKII